jgi:hypothetical protein
LSDFDANQDDMRRISRLSDRELDRLVAGDAGERDLEELAAFFREAKEVLEVPPPMGVAARQVAAIVEAAERAAGDPTVARVRSPQPETRRRPLMQRKLVYVAAGLASLAVFSGAAYADELPAPVQDGVAGVAENVGVSLPSSDDDNDGGGAGSGDDDSQGNQQQPAGANVSQGNAGAGTDDDDVDAGGGQSNVDAGGQGGAGAAEDDDQESGQAGGGAQGGQQSQESQDDDESGSQGGGGGAPAQSGGQDDQDDQGGGGGGGQGGGGQDDDD